MTDLDAETIEPAGAAAPDPRRRRRVLTVLGGTAVGVYLADLVTKIIAVETLADGRPREVVGTVFQFELIRNPGAAFGIGVDMTVVFSLLSLIVIGMVLRASNRLGSTAWSVVFGLVLGGAFGNLTDRVFRSPGFLEGHVVDFLHLKNWPVFNLADTAFCVAAGIVVVLVARNVPLEGRQPR